MNSARMPVAVGSQLPPPSRVVHTPPHDTPTFTCRESRGSTSTEWMPGWSAPPPNHSSRRGSSHSGRLSDHDSPPSSDRNRPPGSVPHQITPGSSAPPGASAHTSFSDQSAGVPSTGVFGV